ncbi:DUF397 domain-containing protein [Cryptosporangium sp. NPDC051539]|uniref:DUF397 domain-containing protein n=1 Tax=Cryptosporangium sp. NPDC051539 TaxID=3363962 RepID=UPI0037A036BB
MTQEPSDPRFFKSSYSGGSGGECVECAYETDAVMLRDSKHPNGTVLAFGKVGWERFIYGIRRGDFKKQP